MRRIQFKVGAFCLFCLIFLFKYIIESNIEFGITILSETESWVLKHLIHPSTTSQFKELNLTEPNRTDYSQAGQSSFLINNLLANKTNGRYLEAGAFDGETFSNTLMLEKHYNWTGILIEPGVVNFDLLKTKNRNAYLLRACLADVSYRTSLLLTIPEEGLLSSIKSEETDYYEDTEVVECIPINVLFKVLNWRDFDLISLDLEGFELEVLKSINWSIINVSYFQVEADKLDRQELITFMQTVGYELYTEIHVDMIFGKLKHN